MLLVRAPLRISICGGGTDLPSYYTQFNAYFISAAINQYIYIALHNVFDNKYLIKYSETERVERIEQIKHPLIREALAFTGHSSPIEICSFADIPAGTGLGSSGAFTVALLKALYFYQYQMKSDVEIAEDACTIELKKLLSPIGKQDQYISAVGGFSQFNIDKKGVVKPAPFPMSESTLVELEEHLLLFFTGYSRDANTILKEQDDRTKQELSAKNSAEKEMIENLHFVQELAYQIKNTLERGDLLEYAKLMNIHWEYKKKRAKSMTNQTIDDLYNLALRNGATGGKLIGAGGGGFLMFFTEDKRKLRKAMQEVGLNEVRFKFEKLGVQVVMNN